MSDAVSNLRETCQELLEEMTFGGAVADHFERLERIRSSPSDTEAIISFFNEIGEDTLRKIQVGYANFLIMREAETVASSGYKYTNDLSFYKARIQFELDMVQQFLGKEIKSAVVFGCGAWPKTVLSLGDIGIKTLGIDIDPQIVSQNTDRLESELISFECSDALSLRHGLKVDAAWIAGTIGLSSVKRTELVANTVTGSVASIVCVRQPVREEQLFFPATPVHSGLVSFNVSVEHPSEYMARSFVLHADHSRL